MQNQPIPLHELEKFSELAGILQILNSPESFASTIVYANSARLVERVIYSIIFHRFPKITFRLSHIDSKEEVFSELGVAQDGANGIHFDVYISERPITEGDILKFRDIAVNSNVKVLLVEYRSAIDRSAIAVKKRQMHELINQIRAKEGLSQLFENEYLEAVATAHCRFITHAGSPTHWGEGRSLPHDRVAASDYDGHYLHEIIAGGSSSCSDVLDRWLDSPTHNKCVLSPSASEIGIAMDFQRTDAGARFGVPMWTILFGCPKKMGWISHILKKVGSFASGSRIPAQTRE